MDNRSFTDHSNVFTEAPIHRSARDLFVCTCISYRPFKSFSYNICYHIVVLSIRNICGMCFSASASLVAFSIAVLSSIYLTFKNRNKFQYFIGIFVFLIGTMQLIEYFLWSTQNNPRHNHLASLLIIAVLYLQVTLAYSVYTFVFKKSSSFMTLLLVFYTAFTVYLLYWLNQHTLFTTPHKGSCRLIWAPYSVMKYSSFGRLAMVVFASVYFYVGVYLLLQLANFYDRYPFSYLFLPITALLALLYTMTQKAVHWGAVFSSFWCFVAVGWGIVAFLEI